MKVAPARERGLKFRLILIVRYLRQVAPARERGLKSLSTAQHHCNACVAPARERGLKLLYIYAVPAAVRRSREGAWIEIKTKQPGI